MIYKLLFSLKYKKTRTTNQPTNRGHTFQEESLRLFFFTILFEIATTAVQLKNNLSIDLFYWIYLFIYTKKFVTIEEMNALRRDSWKQQQLHFIYGRIEKKNWFGEISFDLDAIFTKHSMRKGFFFSFFKSICFSNTVNDGVCNKCYDKACFGLLEHSKAKHEWTQTIDVHLTFDCDGCFFSLVCAILGIRIGHG